MGILYIRASTSFRGFTMKLKLLLTVVFLTLGCFVLDGYSTVAPKSIKYKTYKNWVTKCVNKYGLRGNAKAERVFHTNELKNSLQSPSTIDAAITLEEISKSSKNDKMRFTEGTAVEVTGFIFDIIPGGSETCNCSSADDFLRDTHIPLVTKLSGAFSKSTVVVEVTPKIRHYMDSVKHIDWSTDTLKKLIHKKVKVKGFLLFDAEHIMEAVNTDPKNILGKSNWRKTCWEVHPVTSIEVLKSDGSVDMSFNKINGEYK